MILRIVEVLKANNERKYLIEKHVTDDVSLNQWVLITDRDTLNQAQDCVEKLLGDVVVSKTVIGVFS